MSKTKIYYVDELKEKNIDFKACMPPIGTLYCNFAEYPEMMQLMKNKPYILPHEQLQMSEVLKRYVNKKIFSIGLNDWLVYGELGQLKKYSLHEMTINFKLKIGNFGATKVDFNYNNIQNNYANKIGKSENGYIVDWLPITNIVNTYYNIKLTLYNYNENRNNVINGIRVNFNKTLSGIGDVIIDTGFNGVCYRGLQIYRLFDMRNSTLKKIVSNNCSDYGFSKEDRMLGKDAYVITPFDNVSSLINIGLYIDNERLLDLYRLLHKSMNNSKNLRLSQYKILYKDCIIGIKDKKHFTLTSARLKDTLTFKEIDDLVDTLVIINNETYDNYIDYFSSPIVTPNIAYAIKMYTTGSYEDGTEICSEINRKLNFNKKLTIEEYIILKELVNFIDKSSVIYDITLFRGCQNINDVRPALKSTTLSLDMGYDFASKYNNNKGVINKINIPKYTKAALLTGLSWKGNEDEVLLGLDIGIVMKDKVFSYDYSDSEPHRFIDVIDSEIVELKKVNIDKFINKLDNYIYSEINMCRHSKFLITDNRFTKHEIYVEESGEKLINEICFDYTDTIKIIISTVELKDKSYKFVITLTDALKAAYNKKVQSVIIKDLDESAGILSSLIDMTIITYWQRYKENVVINKLEYKVREIYSTLLNELKALGAIITRSSINKDTKHLEIDQTNSAFKIFSKKRQNTEDNILSYTISIGILDLNSIEHTFRMKIYNKSKYQIEYESSVDGMMHKSYILDDNYLDTSMHKIFHHVAFDLREILKSIKEYIYDYDRYIGYKRKKDIVIKKLKSDHVTALYQFGSLSFEQIGQRIIIKSGRLILKEINYLDGIVDVLDIIYKHVA